MNDVVTLSVTEARELVRSILERHGTSSSNALSVALALVAAEIDGQKGHGLSRLPAYAAQAASGKVNGHAVPAVVAEKASAVRIDAGYGFAFPALDLAIEQVATRARATGVATVTVFRSHHFGQAGYHVERLAEAGLVGLIFGNAPKAIAPWGGRDALFGTNPIAFAAPRSRQGPLIIDLSLSRVARGKIMVAAASGQPIPEGWALDATGTPTTDAQAALDGTMIPMGEAKGAALVLMVEILAAALSGANFGFEASSFFTAEGDSPGVGQLLLAFEPGVLSGDHFGERMESLITAMLSQDGVRLPGSRRDEVRSTAHVAGLRIPVGLHEQLMTL
jgi:(2R)-3-sulfolactate dehydrogenase (NADP+)